MDWNRIEERLSGIIFTIKQFILMRASPPNRQDPLPLNALSADRWVYILPRPAISRTPNSTGLQGVGTFDNDHYTFNDRSGSDDQQ